MKRAPRLVLALAALSLVGVTMGFALRWIESGAASAAATQPDQSAIIAAGDASGHLTGVAASGTPYGPAILRLRDLTAAWLTCEYAHGATKQPTNDGSDSFRVVGVTADVRSACATEEAAAEAIQRTQAYANDAAATVQFTRDALACVQARGIIIPAPDTTVGHLPYTPGLYAAEQDCKVQIESANGIQEPAPLP